jgi:HAD superfamily hydrolase (TIGR01509 family)
MRAVLFDFDGVLVDSEPLHSRAFRECLAAEGIHLTEEEYNRTCIGYDDWTALRLTLERHQGVATPPARVHELAERKAEIYERLLPEVPFYPGARDLVRALAAEVPLAIASGALHDEIERTLAAGGLTDAFTAIVGADDVRQTKPHPEPYLAAMRAVSRRAPGISPAQCLVIEDSTTGVAAGRAAGMRVLAVAHTYPAARLGAAHHVAPALAGLRPDDLRALFR